MARIPQFRSYNPESKKMFHDFDQDIKEVGLGKSIHQFVYETGLCFGTLMQFLGLKDKNGKTYCQDDIVKYRGKFYRLSKGNYMFLLAGFNESGQDNPSDFFSEDAFLHGEIVGNIYEHPELLIDVK
ncbi:YopX family protein [Flavobacterium lipolyticum]|uniref:YopX family protein n=1 Tax=Flavobacterium lipolyticum TaxID=2893754 RepID=A0ABS8LWL9_9FLAO|nr:YopX family protein [Flavobacterium sp. F-126]MCC9016948.1 YopX family protein [Flavobacterium sp. F-126]